MVMPAAGLKAFGQNFSSHHSGIDLIAPFGSPVRAAAAGTVIFVGWNGGYGNMVDVLHGTNIVTRYAHLAGFLYGLHAGMPVQAGDLLGVVGLTGHTTGPHLHFELRIGGKPIDPRPTLAFTACPVTDPEPLAQARAPDAAR